MNQKQHKAKLKKRKHHQKQIVVSQPHKHMVEQQERRDDDLYSVDEPERKLFWFSLWFCAFTWWVKGKFAR
jgi:hypothetical protein